MRITVPHFGRTPGPAPRTGTGPAVARARSVPSGVLWASLALLALGSTACARTISAPIDEEPPEPGFFGDWVGTFQGSQMTLSIREFTNGVAPGEVRWRDVTWDLECNAFVTPERSDLSCEVLPTVPPPFCGDPLPFIDIGQALPRERLEAAVGGIVREGDGSPCDGEVIVSWEPGAGVVFEFS